MVRASEGGVVVVLGAGMERRGGGGCTAAIPYPVRLSLRRDHHKTIVHRSRCKSDLLEEIGTDFKTRFSDWNFTR